MDFSAYKNTIILSAAGVSSILIIIIMGKSLFNKSEEIKNLNENLQTSRTQLQGMERLRGEFNTEHAELEQVRQLLTQEQENIRGLRQVITAHDQLENQNQELLQNIAANTHQMEILQNRTENVIRNELNQELQNLRESGANQVRILAFNAGINNEVNTRVADRDRQIHDLEVQTQGWQVQVLQIQNNRVNLQNRVQDLNQSLDLMTRRQVILNDIINVSPGRNNANRAAQGALARIEADYQARINALNERIQQLEHERA